MKKKAGGAGRAGRAGGAEGAGGAGGAVQVLSLVPRSTDLVCDVEPALVIHIESDEWAVLRLAELREKGERAQFRILVQDSRIIDCFIMRENGTIEQSPDGRLETRGSGASSPAQDSRLKTPSRSSS